MGRTVSAGTDLWLSSEILTYSRSRGLFAGVSLEGAALSLDWQANVAFYGQVMSPGEILAGAELPVPQSAVRLKAWLSHYTAGNRAGCARRGRGMTSRQRRFLAESLAAGGA